MRYLLQSMLLIWLVCSPLPGFAVQNAGLDGHAAKQLLTAEEQQYLEKKQQLTMCVDPDWMPYEKIAQGQHIGMSADFLRLFASKLAIKIEVVPSRTWLESLKLGEQRQCDIFSLVMATPERREFLDFTEAYLSFPLVIAVAFQQDYINELEDVLDKKLGVQKGYAYAELLRLQYPAIKLVEVENLAEGLDRVSRHQLYGMLGSLPDISYAFQTQYIGELKIAGKLAQQASLGIGTRNDEPLLVDIFNKAIAQLSAQERHDIINDWIAIEYVSAVDYTLLLKVASILGLIFAFFLYHYWQLRKCNDRLRLLSVTDKLTHLHNRLKLDQQLDETLHVAQRYQHVFSILLIDIDHFKLINDEYGHLIGDHALQALAQLLKSNIRAVDTLGRWGGEEFLIICPEQTVEGGRQLAEKLRAIIEQHTFEYFSHLSCSFGVAAYTQDKNADDLLKRADDALYRAKNQGRNQVCIHIL